MKANLSVSKSENTQHAKIHKPKRYRASRHIFLILYKMDSKTHTMFLQSFPYMVAISFGDKGPSSSEYTARIKIDRKCNAFVVESRPDNQTILADLQQAVAEDMHEIQSGMPVKRPLFTVCERLQDKDKTLIIHTDNKNMKLKVKVSNRYKIEIFSIIEKKRVFLTY